MFTNKELELISLQSCGAIDRIDKILKLNKDQMDGEKIGEYDNERLYYSSIVEKSVNLLDSKDKSKVDITIPKREIGCNDIAYNGEFLIASFICDDVIGEATTHRSVSFYVDGEKWGSH